MPSKIPGALASGHGWVWNHPYFRHLAQGRCHRSTCVGAGSGGNSVNGWDRGPGVRATEVPTSGVYGRSSGEVSAGGTPRVTGGQIAR